MEHNPANVTETLVTDLAAGMVIAQREGRSSVITKIEKVSPRSRSYDISYRNTDARPDGHHNTCTVTHTGTSYMPVITTNAPVAGPCPKGCKPCADQAAVEAYVAKRKAEGK